MLFDYKPDFEDARRHWQAFWRHEVIDRPCVRVVAPRDGAQPAPHPPGLQHPNQDLTAHLHAFDRWASATYFGGDAVPFFYPNFGPDIFSAFLGADLEGFEHETGTSWAVPFITDWKTDAECMDHPHGYWWEAMLKYTAEARKFGEGKFGVAVLDLHSNLDCLSAVRGAQNLCFDLLDCPDDIERVMNVIRKTYQPIYDTLRRTSGQEATGSSSWLPAYCDGKYGVIQCDYICMIRPEHARKFLYPALEEEAQFLDHCFYHLDGPDALVHLDDILSIEAIDGIQWVPGDGQPRQVEWADLLKRIQKAGKSLHISGTIDEVKRLHKQLRPELAFYDTWAPSQSEADALVDWLRTN